MAVILVFPACNLLSGLPAFGAELLYVSLAAVAEECFFRGFLFTALQKRGKLMAALVTSGLFALLHLVNLANYPLDYTLLQVASAFSVGIALCGLMERAQKLWPCLVCHLLINLTGHAYLTALGVGLTLFCVVFYAGFGLFLLRKKNEVQL